MSNLVEAREEGLFQVYLERGVLNPNPVDSHFPSLEVVCNNRVKGGLVRYKNWLEVPNQRNLVSLLPVQLESRYVTLVGSITGASATVDQMSTIIVGRHDSLGEIVPN